ncbi:hypothetical protein ACLKA6_000847, partial [Drosophila palustris]
EDNPIFDLQKEFPQMMTSTICENGKGEDKIKQAQSLDEWINAIIKALDQGTYDDYYVQHGVLYKDPIKELIVIPSTVEREIITIAHRQGHFGAKKTIDLIEKEYYIPGLTGKVDIVVKSCLECIGIKKGTLAQCAVVANLATVADKATSNLISESKEGEPPTGRMTPNPFLGIKKTARSPTSAPAATSRLALTSTTTPMFPPSTGIADKPESRHPGLITSFDRLGEKIRALSKMLEGRTIHQPKRDLVDIKVAPKLRSLAQHVKAIRKTAKEELPFELSKSADPRTATLQDAVKDLLGPKAEVRSLTATTAIEVRDLDEVTTQEELLEA